MPLSEQLACVHDRFSWALAFGPTYIAESRIIVGFSRLAEMGGPEVCGLLSIVVVGCKLFAGRCWE